MSLLKAAELYWLTLPCAWCRFRIWYAQKGMDSLTQRGLAHTVAFREAFQERNAYIENLRRIDKRIQSLQATRA